MCENGIGNSYIRYHRILSVYYVYVLYAVLAHMVKCKKCRLGLGVWIGIESY